MFKKDLVKLSEIQFSRGPYDPNYSKTNTLGPTVLCVISHKISRVILHAQTERRSGSMEAGSET